MKRFSSLYRRTNLFKTHKRTFALAPHGKEGKLVNRVYNGEALTELKKASGNLNSYTLNHRQTCDIELLMNGAFSPLEGFMTQSQYDGVVNNMHLPDGTIFPMPITFDVSEKQALEIEKSGANQILLRDGEHNPIAVMDVEDIWKPDLELEGETVFGGDPEHPAVHYLNNFQSAMNIGGKLHGIQLPPHYDYGTLRKTPAETRAMFEKNGWNKVVAFQTRNPMHRAHFELTKLALDMDPEMKLLVHPVIGATKPGDIDHHTRVKCYREIMPRYPKGRADLVVFQLAMRMGGPREAIWHCIIRKNYGCTHFILGRDHAGPGANSNKVDFYGPYDARDAAVAVQNELGIKTLAFEMMLYAPEDDKYYPADAVPEGKKVLKLSGTEVRRRLRTGEEIPEWFSFGEVVDILRKAHPPRHKQGFVLLFTGLSGSGKSTIANALREKLMEIQDRRVTLLDGDYVRTLISSELGFSEEDRNLNIKRIGYIASLVSNSGGAVLACPIAPFKESREFARQTCQEVGGFAEVFVSTTFEECAERDTKGLYARATAPGANIALTGMNTSADDRYDIPENPELKVPTKERTVDECVNDVLEYLVKEGYIQQEEVAISKKKAA